jgi:adenylate kinase family enzyme
MTEPLILLSQPDSPAPKGAELAMLRVRKYMALHSAWLERGDTSRHDIAGEACFRQDPGELQAACRELDDALSKDRDSALAQIKRTFGLGREDSDIFDLCLALALEPSLGVTIAALNGHPERGFVTETLAARVFGHGAITILTGDSALQRWKLVHRTARAAGEPAALEIDAAIIPGAVGRYATDPLLAGKTATRAAAEPVDGWPLAATARAITTLLEAGRPVRVWVAGPGGSGRRSFAALVAAKLGLTILVVDTRDVEPQTWADFYLRATRQAALHGVALCWCFGDATPAFPSDLPSIPLAFVSVTADAGDRARHREPQESVADLHLEMPSLSIETRRRLWMRHLPACRAWPDGALDHLAARHRLTLGEIASVARRGDNDASSVARACRELTRYRIGELGRMLDTPFALRELAVPDRLRRRLDDFVHEASERAAFWENADARRLFSRGTGLGALFSGPPGTGKTMAAQAIAGELGLDLVRIDLASVVSKYIGETAKNLRSIFAAAARMDAVLLFDEADALFARRTEVRDAHDKHANADVNYLLQQLEEYPGISILASNQRSQLDHAVIRRLRYVLEFPRPEPSERLAIFNHLITRMAGNERRLALGGALDALAATVDLTGAQIKHAVLSSMFVARRDNAPVAIEHVLEGVERELEKAGRSLRPHERERIMRHG